MARTPTDALSPKQQDEFDRFIAAFHVAAEDEACTTLTVQPEAVQMLLDGHSASSVSQRLGLSGPALLYRWKAQQLQRSGPVAASLDDRVRELEDRPVPTSAKIAAKVTPSCTGHIVSRFSDAYSARSTPGKIVHITSRTFGPPLSENDTMTSTQVLAFSKRGEPSFHVKQISIDLEKMLYSIRSARSSRPRVGSVM